MNLKDAMLAATQKVMSEAKLSDICMINQGHCDWWVGEVLEFLDDDISALEYWIDEDCRLTDEEALDISHCVLWCDGLFYDCITPDGVEDPLKLHLIPGLGPQSAIDWIHSIIIRGNPPNLRTIQ